MNLGIVLAGHSQHVNDLADGRVGILGPLDNFNDNLVSGLAAGEFIQRDEDIGSQELAVGGQLGEILEHLQRADKHLFLAFENFHDFGLGFHAVPCRADVHEHPVAVQGMHRVAFGYHDGQAVVAGGVHAVLAVAAADEDSLGYRRTVGGLVAASTRLDEETVHGQLVQNLDDECAPLGSIGSNSCRHLLVIE